MSRSIGGRKWRVPGEIGNLWYSQFGQKSMVSTFLTQGPVDPLQILVEKTNRASMKRIAELQNVKKEIKKKNAWLKQFPRSPILGIIGTPSSIKSDWKFYLCSDLMIKSVFNVFSHYFNDKMVTDISSSYCQNKVTP